MSSVLDIPEIRQQARPLSVAAYHRLIETGDIGERMELIEGFLIEKMRKSPLHCYVVNHLWDQLRDFCGNKSLLACKDDPLTLADSEPEPDLSVVEGQANDFIHAHPTNARLVVEVAISSIAIDQAKIPSYARAGIPEFWLVRPEDRITDIYRDPSPGGYRTAFTLRCDETLYSKSLPGFQFNLSNILSSS